MNPFAAVAESFIDPVYVPIVEFCESSEYCGMRLFPKQQVLLKLWFLEEMEGWEEDVLSSWIRGDNGVMISPMVRERRDWLRTNGYKHFRQIINDGGRRSSKGVTTGAAIAKKIFDTQQIPDPGMHYGISPDREIVFACIANKLQQARDMQFADVTSWTSRCRPLQPYIPALLEESFTIRTAADEKYKQELQASGIKVTADWAKLVCRPLPANQATIRGSAMLVCVFDEMAHMLGTEGRASGTQCYDAAQPSLRQFGRDALMFLNSSPYTEIGEFYDQYLKAIALEGTVPAFMDYLFFNFPSWELYSDWRKLPGGHKWAATGSIIVSPDADPATLTEEERAKQLIEQRDEKANPEAYSVEARARWAKVVDAYLNPTMVDRAYGPYTVSQPGDPLFFEKQFTASAGHDYNFTYKGHCDPSSTTAGFGLAIGHIEMLPDPFDPTQLCQHVVFDLVKRWDPAAFPGHTINYMEVQREIAELITLYKPYEFTFDQYQSQAPIQWLNQELRTRRMNTRVFEVTATSEVNWNRWETFKTALNLGLVHIPIDCPDSLYSIEELKFLQQKNTSGRYPRVDKQDVGPIRTKDVADCICEVTAHLIGDFIADRNANLSEGIRMGAQGGYPIGGRHVGGPMGSMGGAQSFDQLRDQRMRAAQYGGGSATRGYTGARGGRRNY